MPTSLVQGVALIGAVFFQKMAVTVALNGAVSLRFVALLRQIVPARISYKKPRKNMFFGVKTSVGETCLGQSVALNGACDTI